jgi:dephospho-CoA kinase
VTYDILAMKGGAKLYSQITALYDWSRDSDGPITQGMREVYAEQKKELQKLESELAELLRTELARINDQARSLDVPNIILPAPSKNGKRE